MRSEPEVHAEAARRKTLVMERSVAQLRALVVGINVIAWALFLGPSSPRAPLAIAITGLAVPYAAWSLLARPYQRWPLLRLGAVTLTTDVILITLWVLATGGPDSPYWAIYLVSVVSVGMRYDLAQTVGAAILEAAVYAGLVLVLDGPTRGLDVTIRPAYIVIVGLAAGFLARQERWQREETGHLEYLAGARAAELESERRTVEELRALDRMRTEFVASASHELRTPLTTISGVARTLGIHGHKMTPEQFDEALEAMHRQGERIRLLIENLLDLSQIEHGSPTIRVDDVSLSSVVTTALDLAPPPHPKRVDVSIDPEHRVSADRARLEQVLTNLLTNAYRYGGARVTIQSLNGEGRVQLIVADDGDGVPDDLGMRLFQPFGRGDNVGETVGSGLGLVISRRIVEALGGSLTYEPGEPHGARFTIELPRA